MLGNAIYSFTVLENFVLKYSLYAIIMMSLQSSLLHYTLLFIIEAPASYVMLIIHGGFIWLYIMF
jgi:hypothetical protein